MRTMLIAFGLTTTLTLVAGCDTGSEAQGEDALAVTTEEAGIDRNRTRLDEMDRELQAQHLESDKEAMTEAETDRSG